MHDVKSSVCKMVTAAATGQHGGGNRCSVPGCKPSVSTLTWQPQIVELPIEELMAVIISLDKKVRTPLPYSLVRIFPLLIPVCYSSVGWFHPLVIFGRTSSTGRPPPGGARALVLEGTQGKGLARAQENF